MGIVIDQRSFNQAHNLLERLPIAFERDDVMMNIFRKASLPMIKAGKAAASAAIPNVAKGFVWGRKKSKSGDIMRVGVVNKRGTLGRLAHLFEWGTSQRVVYTTGQNTGRIKPNFFWSRAVSMSEPQVKANVERFAEQEINKYIKRFHQ